jgi:hypothetical protein
VLVLIDDEFYELSSTPSKAIEVVRDKEGGLGEDMGLGEDYIDDDSIIQEQLRKEELAVDLATQLGQHLL